jgi:hypothetical protein
MNYYWICDRSQLAEALSARILPPLKELNGVHTGKLPNFTNGALLVLWNKDYGGEFVLPSCIVCDDEEIFDFIAWISTYFRHLRPFTSQCRVIDRSEASKFFDDDTNPNFPLRGAAMALIIAEVIAHTIGRRDFKKISYTGCAGTLSFAIAQLAANKQCFVGDKGDFTNQLVSAWNVTREIGGRESVRLSPEIIVSIWRILISAIRASNFEKKFEDSSITRVVAKAYNGIDVRLSDFEDVGQAKVVVQSAWNSLDGPREKRVTAIREALQALRPSNESERRSFPCIAGFLVSRVDPGSLEHFEILFAIGEDMPESFMWYAVFAGLFKSNSVGDYMDGLGWLLQRQIDAVGTSSGRPSADIGVRELIVLSRGSELQKPTFRTKNPTTIEVELLPFVVTVLSWSNSETSIRIREVDKSKGQTELFDADSTLDLREMDFFKELDICRIQLRETSDRITKLMKFAAKNRRSGR